MSAQPIYELGRYGGPPPKLSAMQLTPQEWKKAVEDRTRSRVIVGDALLEYALDLAIASRLSTKDEVWHQLLGENGIGFCNKARLAYVLGTIKKGTMQDLFCIHHIRNRFAHMPSPQFDDDELIGDIQRLSTVGNKGGQVTRANYMDFYDKAVTKCEKALFAIFGKRPGEKD